MSWPNYNHKLNLSKIDAYIRKLKEFKKPKKKTIVGDYNMENFNITEFFTKFKEIIFPDVNGDKVLDAADFKAWMKNFSGIYTAFVGFLCFIFGQENIGKLLDQWYYLVLFAFIAAIITSVIIYIRNKNNDKINEAKKLIGIIQSQSAQLVDMANTIQTNNLKHQLEVLELNFRNNCTAEIVKYQININETDKQKIIDAALIEAKKQIASIPNIEKN